MLTQLSNIVNPHHIPVSEEEIEAATDPKLISHNIKLGEEKYRRISKEEWHLLRKKAKLNPFFLGYGILGYDRLSVNLHGHLSKWMILTRKDWRFRECLLPRGHFKTTQFTITDSIRVILPPDDSISKDELSWPDNLGTDCRLLLSHEVLDTAARFLFSITAHFCGNPTLMGLFPECVPSRAKHRINKYELELPRTKIWNEPTIDTMGVGGKNQGRHYNQIKCDDLIGDKAASSLTEMQTAKDWFDNIQSFFSKFREDRLDICGTRWANDDLYSHIHDRYGKQLARYIRPVEESQLRESTNEKGEKIKVYVKEPIFPEEFTTESLSILRKNKRIFSAQYENDPDSGTTEFNPAWIQKFVWRDDAKTLISVFGLHNKRTLSVRDLDVCILIDPAVTGPGGYVTAGMDEFRNIYVLQAIQQELLPSEQWDWVLANQRRWQPRTVGIESVLFSELYKPWYEAEMKLRGIRFNISALATRQKEKPTRVRGLSNPLSSLQVFFCEDPELYSYNLEKEDSDLVYQIKKFGSIKEYHVLDALAYGPEVLRPGFSRSQMEKLKTSVNNNLSKRSKLTGYSHIKYGRSG